MQVEQPGGPTHERHAADPARPLHQSDEQRGMRHGRQLQQRIGAGFLGKKNAVAADRHQQGSQQAGRDAPAPAAHQRIDRQDQAAAGRQRNQSQRPFPVAAPVHDMPHQMEVQRALVADPRAVGNVPRAVRHDPRGVQFIHPQALVRLRASEPHSQQEDDHQARQPHAMKRSHGAYNHQGRVGYCSHVCPSACLPPRASLQGPQVHDHRAQLVDGSAHQFRAVHFAAGQSGRRDLTDNPGPPIRIGSQRGFHGGTRSR